MADYVLVLHEGQVVEAGSADEVIERPAHPYTTSLVDSIPWPDPDRRWPELDPDMRDGWSAKSIIRGDIAGFRLESTTGI